MTALPPGTETFAEELALHIAGLFEAPRPGAELDDEVEELMQLVAGSPVENALMHTALDLADAHLWELEAHERAHGVIERLRPFIDDWLGWDKNLDRTKEIVEWLNDFAIRVQEALGPDHLLTVFSPLPRPLWNELGLAVAMLDELDRMRIKMKLDSKIHHWDEAKLRGLYRQHLEYEHHVHRQERLAARAAARPEPVVPAPRLCSACGKKEARVDDLCKRCAHDQGVLPHGKI